MTNYTKETYLAARAEWKANYAQLTLDARRLRAEFNEAQRVFAKTPAYNYHSGYWAAHKAVEQLRSERAALRYEAYTQINVRAQMKEDAAMSWEASREK